MAFMSVASKRAASEVVVEQVDVVRVMLLEGSGGGAELVAMMLTSPEDGVAVTSPAMTDTNQFYLDQDHDDTLSSINNSNPMIGTHQNGPILYNPKSCRSFC